MKNFKKLSVLLLLAGLSSLSTLTPNGVLIKKDAVGIKEDFKPQAVTSTSFFIKNMYKPQTKSFTSIKNISDLEKAIGPMNSSATAKSPISVKGENMNSVHAADGGPMFALNYNEKGYGGLVVKFLFSNNPKVWNSITTKQWNDGICLVLVGIDYFDNVVKNINVIDNTDFGNPPVAFVLFIFHSTNGKLLGKIGPVPPLPGSKYFSNPHKSGHNMLLQDQAINLNRFYVSYWPEPATYGNWVNQTMINGWGGPQPYPLKVYLQGQPNGLPATK